MEPSDNFLDGIDLEGIARGKMRYWLVVLFPIITITFFVISISGEPYDIDTELNVASGEYKIHNLDEGVFYFLSKTCTDSLLDYHEVSDEDREEMPWGDCEGTGLLNVTVSDYTSDGTGLGGIVNYTTVECKMEFVKLGASSDEYYFCYGGVTLEEDQYHILNDSPFDVELIEEDEYKEELTLLFEKTPFVSVAMGYITVVATCCVLPFLMCVGFLFSSEHDAID